MRTADGAIEATTGAGDRLERLFGLEKTVVLGLLERIDVRVTPAELRAITERPTQDLQAFLAASRGLEAEARPPLSNPGVLTRVASAVAPTELAARTAPRSCPPSPSSTRAPAVKSIAGLAFPSPTRAFRRRWDRTTRAVSPSSAN